MTLGERFAHAFAAKDHDAVRSVLADDVDFLALTPRKFWEANDREKVVEFMFGSWVEDQDHVEAVESIEPGEDVADTHRVAYRLALRTPDGPHVMEQQAYYRTENDRISYLRIMCSGFRPRS